MPTFCKYLYRYTSRSLSPCLDTSGVSSSLKDVRISSQTCGSEFGWTHRKLPIVSEPVSGTRACDEAETKSESNTTNHSDAKKKPTRLRNFMLGSRRPSLTSLLFFGTCSTVQLFRAANSNESGWVAGLAVILF